MGIEKCITDSDYSPYIMIHHSVASLTAATVASPPSNISAFVINDQTRINQSSPIKKVKACMYSRIQLHHFAFEDLAFNIPSHNFNNIPDFLTSTKKSKLKYLRPTDQTCLKQGHRFISSPERWVHILNTPHYTHYGFPARLPASKTCGLHVQQHRAFPPSSMNHHAHGSFTLCLVTEKCIFQSNQTITHQQNSFDIIPVRVASIQTNTLVRTTLATPGITHCCSQIQCRRSNL